MMCLPRTSSSRPALPRARGFTLIELLVVIAIIGLLAALVVGGAGYAREASVRNRVKTELKQLETALEAYHKKFGFYPPDNPGKPERPPLYYELTGEGLPAALATPFLGVKGIVNSQVDEEGRRAPNFFSNLGVEDKSFKDIDPNPATKVFVLTLAVDGPDADPRLNAWRYVSKNPTNNTESYDLWAEVMVGNKKIVIGNWKD